MKLLLLVLMTLPLSGCLLELLTTTAIQGELAAQNAQSATRALSYAKESLANTELQHGIDAYTAENGYYPPSLNVLVPDYVTSIPTKPDGSAYGYDPQTGKIFDPAESPAKIPFTSGDKKNLQRIKDAIYLYWESTGYYPRNLDDLDPLYVKSLPLLSSGGKFIYDRQTGSVYHPAELAPPPNAAPSTGTGRRVGVPVAGGGPVGEVMTGIAIQNELNSMNNSGTSGAGAAGRRSVNNISGQHTDRQMQTLRDLDLQ